MSVASDVHMKLMTGALATVHQSLSCAGLSCFQGMTPGGGSGCDGAPLLPVLYVSMNLAYNISLLNLLRSAGQLHKATAHSWLLYADHSMPSCIAHPWVPKCLFTLPHCGVVHFQLVVQLQLYLHGTPLLFASDIPVSSLGNACLQVLSCSRSQTPALLLSLSLRSPSPSHTYKTRQTWVLSL